MKLTSSISRLAHGALLRSTRDEQTDAEWIAQLRVIFVYRDGHRVDGRIAIGKPYRLGDGVDLGLSYEAHCPVEITGIHSRNHPPIGGGTMQALFHAMSLVGTLVHDFVANDGRILEPDDETDMPLDAIFGSLLRE